MSSIPGPMQAALTVLVLTAALYDIRYQRIPNWLVAIGFVAGVLMATLFFRADGLRKAFLGAIVAFAIYLPLFAVRAMGAGDLKLMVAVGAFTGPSNWIVVFAISSMLGAVLAAGLLLYRGQLGRTPGRVLFILRELLHLRPPYRARPELDVAHPGAVRLPHGVSIAGGTLLFLVLKHYWL